jgi:hypothetical protein
MLLSKDMIKRLDFDILDVPHLTLANFFAIMIIIKLLILLLSLMFLVKNIGKPPYKYR